MVRAVVQTGPRQMEMREYPRPVLGGDTGALLRVEACGICGSDVEQYKGAMGTRGLPMIPGHEPLGIIEEITDETAARWACWRATASRWRSSSPAGPAPGAWRATT